MEDSFEMLRGERRSFFCPNKLWKKLKEETKDYISVSTYVRQAIIEKMQREKGEEPELDEKLID